MNANDIFLVCILVVAAADVVFATFVVPRVLASSSAAPVIRMVCYIVAGVLTLIGVVVHQMHIIASSPMFS